MSGGTDGVGGVGGGRAGGGDRAGTSGDRDGVGSTTLAASPSAAPAPPVPPTTDSTTSTADLAIPADLVVGEDGRARPAWASTDPLLRSYYDTEWGLPVRSEKGVFERLSLEAFQSGLSWVTILRKRPAFREVFVHFDPEVVAAFGEEDVARLLGDTRIVRNRAKILATVGNAAATLRLRDEVEGGLAGLVWSFQPGTTPRPRTLAEVPTSSEESAALAATLKRYGFRFVGPTTSFALMEAIGIVDTHLVGAWRRGCSGLWDEDGRRGDRK